jgi:hypothetical protein
MARGVAATPPPFSPQRRCRQTAFEAPMLPARHAAVHAAPMRRAAYAAERRRLLTPDMSPYARRPPMSRCRGAAPDRC